VAAVAIILADAVLIRIDPGLATLGDQIPGLKAMVYVATALLFERLTRPRLHPDLYDNRQSPISRRQSVSQGMNHE
jgi:hypothetical protein